MLRWYKYLNLKDPKFWIYCGLTCDRSVEPRNFLIPPKTPKMKKEYLCCPVVYLSDYNSLFYFSEDKVSHHSYHWYHNLYKQTCLKASEVCGMLTGLNGGWIKPLANLVIRSVTNTQFSSQVQLFSFFFTHVCDSFLWTAIYKCQENIKVIIFMKELYWERICCFNLKLDYWNIRM